MSTAVQLYQAQLAFQRKQALARKKSKGKQQKKQAALVSRRSSIDIGSKSSARDPKTRGASRVTFRDEKDFDSATDIEDQHGGRASSEIEEVIRESAEVLERFRSSDRSPERSPIFRSRGPVVRRSGAILSATKRLPIPNSYNSQNFRTFDESDEVEITSRTNRSDHHDPVIEEELISPCEPPDWAQTAGRPLGTGFSSPAAAPLSLPEIIPPPASTGSPRKQKERASLSQQTALSPPEDPPPSSVGGGGTAVGNGGGGATTATDLRLSIDVGSPNAQITRLMQSNAKMKEEMKRLAEEREKLLKAQIDFREEVARRFTEAKTREQTMAQALDREREEHERTLQTNKQLVSALQKTTAQLKEVATEVERMRALRNSEAESLVTGVRQYQQEINNLKFLVQRLEGRFEIQERDFTITVEDLKMQVREAQAAALDKERMLQTARSRQEEDERSLRVQVADLTRAWQREAELRQQLELRFRTFGLDHGGTESSGPPMRSPRPSGVLPPASGSRMGLR